MKKILGIYAVLALTVVSCKETATDKFVENNATTQAPAINVEDLPVISFDKEVLDIGNLTMGQIGQGAIEITNTGKTDLVIYAAQGSCGCTVPEVPNQPIKPGESYTMNVTFDSAGKPGLQQKTVTLATNTAIGKEMFLVKAQVLTQ
ncbi:DUF1573 domain-containing protein [Flavobacterium agricola]|uniref:DUF1573 domain-containing protein n=1 Tax=Flavobacterium agricola TaxID=2870839 RepID=A0ABY6LXV2_9FLAO|nr:DUF1573 domain-containing protein [Flavobacterium agricola]UYW00372.1 DUF1573 domain-containing protein [Flavobacterium agricola]